MRPLSFGRALRDYREQAALKQTELAGRIGVSGPYVSLLESGKRPPPADVVTRRLESALGLSTGTLLRLAHIARTPEDIRQATELDRLYAEGRLEKSEASGRAGVAAGPFRRIPLINKVSAGYPSDFTDLDYPAGVADEYVVVPDLTDPSAFAITVCGDSMTPRFGEGDILIISPDAAVAGGDFCFVRIDAHGEVTSTFKQVFFDEPDTVRLVSLNPRYAAQVYPREGLSGIYKAVRRLEVL
ncbi:MAG TPA: S24 family peptidase [Planctomycetota bacterium]|nr:S24 family peptidase [Planctomycetota bacterium]